MVEDGMTRLEFRQKLTYARLKPSRVCGEQLLGSPIDPLGPSSIINAGDVDVVGKNQFLYGLQNLGTLFRVQGHLPYSLSFDDMGRHAAPSTVKPAHW
jgi:hypothetical protein